MNRFDEIMAKALDVASNVHHDREAMNEMATSLIELVGMMMDAMGKGVAVDAESEMNSYEPDDSESQQQHTIYLTGEQIQRCAQSAVTDAVNADLDRWQRIDPGTSCHCGHVPKVHTDLGCTGETFNREPCKGGPCMNYVPKLPTGGWTYKDRRPAVPGSVSRGAGPCTCDPFCGAHEAPPQPDCTCQPERTLDLDLRKVTYEHAGDCALTLAEPPSQPRCTWIPGDAAPSCDWDPSCNEHGASRVDVSQWLGRAMRRLDELGCTCAPQFETLTDAMTLRLRHEPGCTLSLADKPTPVKRVDSWWAERAMSHLREAGCTCRPAIVRSGVHQFVLVHTQVCPVEGDSLSTSTSAEVFGEDCLCVPVLMFRADDSLRGLAHARPCPRYGPVPE